ncbi:MAG TPA: GatB/YqeY domain-containing protein [Clostridiales bacterium]|nr:GatB/YqeY domain-containing protein [Clostridiales bacterium]
MSLKEQLLNDLKTAMKEKDTVRKDSVQMVRSAVLQVEKDKKVTLDDDGIIDIIAKEIKQRKDVLPDYEKSGRQDLVDRQLREIEILSQYMPQQLSEQELETIVRETVRELGANSVRELGKVMQAVMPKVRGKADGKLVNQIAKKVLG